MFRKHKIIILLTVLAAGCASGTAAASPSSAVINTFPAVTPSAAPGSQPANLQTADGYDLTTLVSKDHETDDGYVDSVRAEGNVLPFDGKLFYNTGEKGFDDTAQLAGEGILSFTIDDHTQDLVHSGSAADSMSETNWLAYVQQCMDSGLGLSITVSNDVVEDAAIVS